MCACPFCDGASSLQFNIEKGLWNCFRCSEKGNAKSLVRRLGGQYIDPVVSSEVLRAQFDRLRTKLRLEKQETEKDDRLPESSLLRYSGPTHPYWESRGFSEATIARWGLGYDPITDRCTIPVREADGSLLGVIQRRLDDIFPRYIYPEGFDRLGTLFGSWNLPEGTTTVAVVEGSTDVLTTDQVGVPSVAQFGSSIGPRQVRLLSRLGIRKLVLFYDYDEAGLKAVEDARKKCEGFLLEKVVWDKEKYCWHEKLCGCGQHTWRDISFCKEKLRCTCGRKHKMDPGQLRPREIRRMYENPVKIGSRKEKKWHTRRPASSRSAAKRRSGD